MKKKTMTIHSYGFAVRIKDAPVKKVLGEVVLDVDNNKLDNAVLNALILKRGSLTGCEIKFIRNFLKMTKVAFGKKFGSKSHTAVMKWENKAEEVTKMSSSTEKDIRLYIAHSLKKIKSKDFERIYIELTDGNLLDSEPLNLLQVAL